VVVVVTTVLISTGTLIYKAQVTFSSAATSLTRSLGNSRVGAPHGSGAAQAGAEIIFREFVIILRRYWLVREICDIAQMPRRLSKLPPPFGFFNARRSHASLLYAVF
jgi:hypothetical protein